MKRKGIFIIINYKYCLIKDFYHYELKLNVQIIYIETFNYIIDTLSNFNKTDSLTDN